MKKESLYLSVYSYHDRTSGIVRGSFDEDKGELTVTGRLHINMPDYLTVDGKHLYAVHAKTRVDAQPADIQEKFDHTASAVAMISLRDFTVEAGVPLLVSNACHIHRRDGWLFAADYHAGAFSAQAGENGRVIAHEGSGADANRQSSPHPHFVHTTPDGKYLAVCDLGIDAVMMYPFDRKTGLGAPIRIDCPPGSGPRHAVVTERHLYVACELSNRVLRYSLRGDFPLIDSKSTLPRGYTGESYAAAIHLSPDGRRLGVSNRGHESVALFDILPGGGLAEPIFIETVRAPREFAFSPSGKWIIGGSQTEGIVTATPARAGGRAKPILPMRSGCMIFA